MRKGWKFWFMWGHIWWFSSMVFWIDVTAVDFRGLKALRLMLLLLFKQHAYNFRIVWWCFQSMSFIKGFDIFIVIRFFVLLCLSMNLSQNDVFNLLSLFHYFCLLIFDCWVRFCFIWNCFVDFEWLKRQNHAFWLFWLLCHHASKIFCVGSLW